jgi:hypothetical protein
LSSAFLEKGEVLILNSIGLEESKSLRKARDGFTYFGCKKSIKKIVKGVRSYFAILSSYFVCVFRVTKKKCLRKWEQLVQAMKL